MLQTYFIARLLSPKGTLLGWGRLEVEARGDGAFWPTSLCAGIGEQTGIANRVVMHWPDVHARWTAPLNDLSIVAGDTFALEWQGPVLRMDNPADHDPLQAVTVRKPVNVSVPTGVMGLRGL